VDIKQKKFMSTTTSKSAQIISLVLVITFCIAAPIAGYINIGLAPVVIIGGSALIGFFFWYFTYLKHPTDPKIILPIFVLAVAGLQIHIVEEYLTGFGPAMSRVFNIPWSEKSFVMVFALVGPAIYTLQRLVYTFASPSPDSSPGSFLLARAYGFTHSSFPVEPQIDPFNADSVTRVITATKLHKCRIITTRQLSYYFSGMWTAVLPMIPGMYAIYRLTRNTER
jgi:hypothetical protein